MRIRTIGKRLIVKEDSKPYWMKDVAIEVPRDQDGDDMDVQSGVVIGRNDNSEVDYGDRVFFDEWRGERIYLDGEIWRVLDFDEALAVENRGVE